MVPPRHLENLLRLLLPPDSREHVLGDLQERYTSTKSYLIDALSVIGPVIISRIRRTTDFQVFLMEALTIYLSFTTVAWYLGEQNFLYHHDGFVLLALPASVAVIALLFCNAYSDLEKRSFSKAVLQSVGSLGLAFLGQAVIFDTHASFAIPFRIMLYGSVLSCSLISPLRILFPPTQRRPKLVTSNQPRPFQHRPLGPALSAQRLSKTVTKVRTAPKLSLILAMLAALLAAALLLVRLK
jgi:hypothetical protein